MGDRLETPRPSAEGHILPPAAAPFQAGERQLGLLSLRMLAIVSENQRQALRLLIRKSR